MPTDPDDTLVPVHVPRRHLTAVYGFIASLEAAGHAEALPEPATTWSVADLSRFAETPTATSLTIGKVLDVLAGKPGDYFSTTQLEELTGVPRPNLKGAFSALTRHINKHYDGRDWMLEFRWGTELGAGHPAEAHYRLTEEQADLWKQARSS
ncbi:hypothetical protein Kisp01_69180 [Kineosporia sp. NBRC 101677]|uniref:hypothetical protein n=1 Tax=Kineosporia sp. NBRC 101677 TaxID=3032197 RepID=UPI0024A5B5DF|nr:hypothetical protein [Kineosporia sp. NBRC 101677]GLY19904.1 hypothetical protein Kisp01_69180 [Kineosporia sp. NBRC 101677]